jgi:hydrogenase maturation protease
VRGDDAAGLEVARRLPALPGALVEAFDGEPIDLVGRFHGFAAAVLIDAVRGGGPAGTVHRFDASHVALPVLFGRSTSHAIGLGETIELGRALGRLPRRVIVFGVSGAEFAAGASLHPAVADAVERVVVDVASEVRALAARPPS